MTTPIIATTGPVVTPVVRWPDAYGFQFVYDGTFAVQAYRTAQERDTGMAFQLDHGRTVRPFLIPGESDPHPHADLMRRAADRLDTNCLCDVEDDDRCMCEELAAELRAAAGEGSTQ